MAASGGLGDSRGQMLSHSSSKLWAALGAAGLLLGAVGCGDDDDGDGGGGGTTDPADNGVRRCGKPVVYVNWGPVTLLKGNVDDSKTNVSTAPFDGETLELPAYRVAADQAALSDLIDKFLAGHKIPVMHSRPTSGDYFMLVMVKDFMPGIQGGHSTINCDHENPNTIGLVSTDFYSFHGGIENALHGSMLMFGRSLGLDTVSLGLARGNCMVNNEFLSTCTFGSVTATNGPCSKDNGPQDQLKALQALSCQ